MPIDKTEKITSKNYFKANSMLITFDLMPSAPFESSLMFLDINYGSEKPKENEITESDTNIR